MRLKDFNETFDYQLRDPEIARLVLEEALQDEDPRVFLLALRNIARANNFSQVTREAGIGRESAYTSLSENGNPSYLTIQAILKAVGLRFSIEQADKAA